MQTWITFERKRRQEDYLWNSQYVESLWYAEENTRESSECCGCASRSQSEWRFSFTCQSRRILNFYYSTGNWDIGRKRHTHTHTHANTHTHKRKFILTWETINDIVKFNYRYISGREWKIWRQILTSSSFPPQYLLAKLSNTARRVYSYYTLIFLTERIKERQKREDHIMTHRKQWTTHNKRVISLSLEYDRFHCSCPTDSDEKKIYIYIYYNIYIYFGRKKKWRRQISL